MAKSSKARFGTYLLMRSALTLTSALVWQKYNLEQNTNLLNSDLVPQKWRNVSSSAFCAFSSCFAPLFLTQPNLNSPDLLLKLLPGATPLFFCYIFPHEVLPNSLVESRTCCHHGVVFVEYPHPLGWPPPLQAGLTLRARPSQTRPPSSPEPLLLTGQDVRSGEIHHPWGLYTDKQIRLV